MTSRDLGEALFWLGLVGLLATAGANRSITGNLFVVLFAADAVVLFGGLYLAYGDWRPR